ncbi:MAG: hypothetical protein V4671_10415, partial [Armatimonadota bacterium]
SLLSDQTAIASDVGPAIVCREARKVFERLTKIELEETIVNGLPQYDPDDIARVYSFFGLNEK